jgi:hypothetical protein
MLGYCGRVFGGVSREMLAGRDVGFDGGGKWVPKTGLRSGGGLENLWDVSRSHRDVGSGGVTEVAEPLLGSISCPLSGARSD